MFPHCCRSLQSKERGWVMSEEQHRNQSTENDRWGHGGALWTIEIKQNPWQCLPLHVYNLNSIPRSHRMEEGYPPSLPLMLSPNTPLWERHLDFKTVNTVSSFQLTINNILWSLLDIPIPGYVCMTREGPCSLWSNRKLLQNAHKVTCS